MTYKTSLRRRLANSHAVSLERTAAKMRAYNLTHGSGCRSTARAIERRKAK